MPGLCGAISPSRSTTVDGSAGCANVDCDFQSSLRDANASKIGDRGLKPTAKLRPSLREEDRGRAPGQPPVFHTFSAFSGRAILTSFLSSPRLRRRCES